jgi:pyruvate dehydrogenase E2 component (dihydrolipoamide acetyltransferase)
VAEFRMPSLGADMEAGTLVEWLVKPGDLVKRGDIVAVVETQKGAIEIETFQPGQIEKLLVDLHSTVPVGTPLALIRTEAEGKVAAVVAAPPPRAPPVAPTPSPFPAPGPIARPIPPPFAPGLAVRGAASPAARRLAQEHGSDLSTITGSGPSGAITYADVERRLGATAPGVEKKRTSWLDPTAMRTAIAAAMARSKREIPHYYLEYQIDVTPCERWLAQKNAALPPDNRLLIGALALKAVALAIHRFPTFNGFYRDNKFEPSTAVHVGMAIAIRGGGLAAPALHDADQLPLDELMSSMRDLVQRTRAGRIRSSEMSDPTITVSSLGERGVDVLYGIIYPPQVAMGALFLAEIGKLLQEPEQL